MLRTSFSFSVGFPLLFSWLIALFIQSINCLLIHSFPSAVDGGTRAVIFDKIFGVSEKVITEGSHLRVPFLQEPIIMDIRARPRLVPWLSIIPLRENANSLFGLTLYSWLLYCEGLSIHLREQRIYKWWIYRWGCCRDPWRRSFPLSTKLSVSNSECNLRHIPFVYM